MLEGKLATVADTVRNVMPERLKRSLWNAKCSHISSEQKAFWMKNGYLILPGLFSKTEVNNLNRVVDEAWSGSLATQKPLVADIFIGTPKEARVDISKAPKEAKSLSYKLNDLYLERDEVRALALHDSLMTVLRDLMGGTPVMCNSLNFERGSQQDYHTDSLYMPAPSGRAMSVYESHMAASWIALEDCDADAGPLRYYPGSHLISPYRFSSGRITAIPSEMNAYKAHMQREVERLGLKSETFCPKAGDVLVWHELLFHGGSPILNPAKTRKSLVVHYWRAEDMPGAKLAKSFGGHYLSREPQPIK